ncbi:MAG: pilin [Candidatus Staskawiczbacteria bacterium]|nr:pilin [Candidatus Staskawiczbacteria bacterium]
MKRKKLFIFIIIIFIFAFTAGLTFAKDIKLETKYPFVPGLPPVTGASGLGDYVGYFFGLGVYVAGALALISLAVSGVQLIYSGVSPESNNNAKDRMKGAVLGLVLTLSAFILLRTINPEFITPALTPLGGVAGVFYTNGNDLKAAPISESNVSASETIKEGYKNIRYCCNAPNDSGKCPGGDGPTLLVWIFPQKNFQGNDTNFSGVNIQRVTCGGESSVGNGSFKMAFETPGVYYYMEKGCNGYMSEVNLSDQDNLGEPFYRKIQSFGFVNDESDPEDPIYYGTIFHSADKSTDGGQCTKIIKSSETSCENINFEASSVTIFKWQRSYYGKFAGDGIEFYSEPYGWDTGQQAGYNKEDAIADKIQWGLTLNAVDTIFKYEKVNRPEEYKQYCSNLQVCPGSIRINGDYLVGLYALSNPDTDPKNASSGYCQIFKKENIPNLETQQFIQAGGEQLGTIEILPIK